MSIAFLHTPISSQNGFYYNIQRLYLADRWRTFLRVCDKILKKSLGVEKLKKEKQEEEEKWEKGRCYLADGRGTKIISSSDRNCPWSQDQRIDLAESGKLLNQAGLQSEQFKNHIWPEETNRKTQKWAK